MQTILMLGASHFQTPAIKYAKEAGYNVISVDNVPANPGHRFSDRYENISTIDKDKVLAFAQSQPIDGVLAYASDPSAPTAAYVAEKLGLPGNPYHSVLTLQRKDLFRHFLDKNGYNVPRSKTFQNLFEAAAYTEYLLESNPVIIKPVDSSGSKGVNKIELMSEFEIKFHLAKKFSFTGKIIIEELIQKKGYQMDGDGFIWQGKLLFHCFGNQHNNENAHPFVPIGISFPYLDTGSVSHIAASQVNDILTLLEMRFGGINIEFIVDRDDRIYILEIGPRSGGNLIPEVIKYSTNIDLIASCVEAALGNDCSNIENCPAEGFFASYILHSIKDGNYKDTYIDEKIRPHIIEHNLLVKPGEYVHKFTGSNHTMGTFIMKFHTLNDMLTQMDSMHSLIYPRIS